MFKSKHICLLLLILLTVLVYSNSFGNSFVWDDFNTVVDNELIRSHLKLTDIFLNPQGPFYRPIPLLTIIFDHSLWGMNPFGYHWTNFLFHLFSVILVFYLSREITGHLWGSFICALLFAIHPVHTETVTYISGRSDSICAFFLFLSFCLYIRFSNARVKRRNSYLFASLIVFAFALLSKEYALIFPVLIFAYNLSFLRCSLKEKLRKVNPFVILTIAFLLFRYFFVKEGTVIIATGNLNVIFKTLLFYIGLLVFPFNLHMQHNLKENLLLFNMPFFLSVVIFLIFVFIVIKYCRKKSTVFGLFWFIIGMLPFAILRLNSHAEIAEHWLYLPSFGLFLGTGIFFTQIKNLRIKKIILTIFVVGLSILTVQRNNAWRSDIAIYQDTLRYHPDNVKVHYNLGNAYLRRNMLAQAEKAYLIALALNSDYADAYFNLGIVLEKQGKSTQAEQLYRQTRYLDSQPKQSQENVPRFQFISSAFAEAELHFDHRLWGDVLGSYLKDGKVDYVGLKENIFILDIYLKKVAGLNPKALKSMSRNQKIAFYINVYNALTLKVIADYYPVESIKDIPGVWDKIKFKVATKELTLNHIEHQILRKKFKEPRVHFTLVCASIGCPQLAPEPFNGKDLDEQLNRQARNFINDKTKVRLDKGNQTLYLSPIFKWFKKDFGNVIKFISEYLPGDDAEFIKEKNPKIKYLNYDWSLNEKS